MRMIQTSLLARSYVRSYKQFSLYIIVCLLSVAASFAHAETTLNLTVANDVDISIQVYPARGDTLLILQPSEAGLKSAELDLAKTLPQAGVEVWLIDLLEAHFLPATQSSMDLIPATDMQMLIDYAWQKTHKKIVLMTTDRGAIPVLRGAAAWQQSPTHDALAGLILVHPKLFVETPDPGEAAELMPVVETTNQAIYILQPKLSPWWWKRKITIPALRKSGSDVYVQALDNVRDRFYFRPDATVAEKKLAAQLPTLTLNALGLLTRLPDKKRRAVTNSRQAPAVRVGKKERSLQAFKGDPAPPLLELNNLAGKAINLKNYQGKVVLVNFWASWCPPCVHEMPSMQRLLDRYKNKGFDILAVNMAEDKATINNFLNTKVKVNFPILLDNDGAALQRWQVFAFPTSYVIDKQGRIRYALFGGLEWDVPHITDKLEMLLAE